MQRGTGQCWRNLWCSHWAPILLASAPVRRLIHAYKWRRHNYGYMKERTTFTESSTAEITREIIEQNVDTRCRNKHGGTNYRDQTGQNEPACPNSASTTLPLRALRPPPVKSTLRHVGFWSSNCCPHHFVLLVWTQTPHWEKSLWSYLWTT